MIVRRHRAHPRFVFFSLPVVILIALLLSACGDGTATATPATGGATGTSGMAGMDNTVQATVAAEPFDEQFIDMMTPHHMGAVAMAQIAMNRAEYPELKAIASSIIASQNSEIGRMQQWRKDWYGSDQTPPMDQMPMLPGMNMNAMNDITMAHDMQNLQTATPFDKAFLMDMIPHHQSAIAAAKIAQDKGTHPEIKQLAGTIIADQQKEIDQMQGWMKAWYP
ncbi:MAG TPA: DUF305 domain-containing protein [Gemmatimonadaceae bacterium]